MGMSVGISEMEATAYRKKEKTLEHIFIKEHKKKKGCDSRYTSFNLPVCGYKPLNGMSDLCMYC